MSTPTDVPKSSTSAPTLPSNLTIFSPINLSTINTLLNGLIFTRLTTTSSTSPEALASALRLSNCEAFCLVHHNVILIFTGAGAGETSIQDAHHEHFRAVCLALKEKDISLSVSGCIFDAKDAAGAGFQFDRLQQGSVMVVDLMDGQDEDEDEDEDENEDEYEDEEEDEGEEDEDNENGDEDDEIIDPEDGGDAKDENEGVKKLEMSSRIK